MDYLDNELVYSEAKVLEERKPKSNRFRKLCLFSSISYFAVTGIKLFKARHETAKKISIGKSLYKYWFPFFLSIFILYPLDNFLWSTLNGQINFWQNSVFTLKSLKT